MGQTSNEKWLFWASFLTLIAAGMGFAIRGDILAEWGRQFGFTQSELGTISGMGLVGFGLTIIVFSFLADLVGYGRLMVLAFLFHVLSVVLTLAAPMAFQAYGKPGAYWCLYLGQLSFSLANGTCEAVINPLTATLFPHNKTHWLNILHAGWPGGLVLGALVGVLFNQIGVARWEIQWGIILAPMLLYGVMMLGRPFPRSEARESGIPLREMMRPVGLLGAAVVMLLFGLWLREILAGFEVLPAPVSASVAWGVVLVIWLGFGFVTGFTIGHWMLTLLFVLHALVGYVELGTDSWIIDITKKVIDNKTFALMAFIWTNVLMFTLRFFAGPIVHKISPLGLLFCSAVLGTAGLLFLGQAGTAGVWIAAVTVYGIGKTFYWPTMLGVVSERFPRGGAVTLGMIGGIGMLSAGVLGSPGIGYKQDLVAADYLKEVAPDTYERYKADEAKAPLPYLPQVAGLNNSKVAVLADHAEKLTADLELSGGADPNVVRLHEWWVEVARPHMEKDLPLITAATLHAGKTALTWTAAVPAVMAVGYLLLIFYFLARGGYQAEVLVGHKAEDEKFTGGVVGPAGR